MDNNEEADAHVVKRRRLIGKQTPAACWRHKTRETLGRFYDILGVEHNANLTSIQAAYRNRALETQIDHVSLVSKLSELGIAFEVVISAKRQLCSSKNRSFTARCSKEGTTLRNANSGNIGGVRTAKAGCAALLMVPPRMWASILAAFSTPTLHATAALLRSKCSNRTAIKLKSRKRKFSFAYGKHRRNSKHVQQCKMPTESSSSSVQMMPHSYVSTTATQSGILRCGRGFSVRIEWHSFVVQSGQPILLLQQAVDLHIVLVLMRNQALSRIQQCSNAYSRTSLHSPAQCFNGTSSHCAPVLLQSELAEVLVAEPCSSLLFFSEFGIRRRKSLHVAATPKTPNLDTALRFRHLASRLFASPQNAAVHTGVWRQMASEARQDRLAHRLLLRDAARAVRQELAREVATPTTPSVRRHSSNEGGDTSRCQQSRGSDHSVCARSSSRTVVGLQWPPPGTKVPRNDRAAGARRNIKAVVHIATRTGSWLPWMEETVANGILMYLDLRSRARLCNISPEALGASTASIKADLQLFTYTSTLFCGRRSSKGRPIMPNTIAQARHLVAMLCCPRLASCFQRLDLKDAPLAIFKVAELPNVLINMSHLRCIQIPPREPELSNFIQAIVSSVSADGARWIYNPKAAQISKLAKEVDNAAK